MKNIDYKCLAVSRSVIKLAAFIGLFCLVACSNNKHSIQYTPDMTPVMESKSNIKVAVFDFDDLTDGENGKNWFNGWSYNNLSSLMADIAAQELIRTGHFLAVDRVPQKYTSRTLKAKNYDIVVTGSIAKFIVGGTPHPTVWINPFCLFAFVGIPTAYVSQDGSANTKFSMIETSSSKTIGEVNSRVSRESGIFFVSLYTQFSDFKTYGELLSQEVAKSYKKQLNELLDSGLGNYLEANTK